MDLPFALEVFFFEKVNAVDGSTGHFHFPLYYICASLTPHSCKRRLLLHCISTVYVGAPRNCPWGVLFLKGQRVDGSHLNGVCRWTSQFALEGFFFEKVNRSTGQTGRLVNGFFFEKVNRSMGQRVTFTFTILYMIADNTRLTPPRCKKHTAYDDTRLTPHHCKKHTASFARSTGKFPSIYETGRYVAAPTKYPPVQQSDYLIFRQLYSSPNKLHSISLYWCLASSQWGLEISYSQLMVYNHKIIKYINRKQGRTFALVRSSETSKFW